MSTQLRHRARAVVRRRGHSRSNPRTPKGATGRGDAYRGWPDIPGAREAEEAAKKLLAAQRQIGGQRSVTDVYAWPVAGGWKFAFTGKPSALTLAFRLGFDRKGDLLASLYPFNRGVGSSWARNGVAAEMADRVFGEEGGHNGHWGDADVHPHDILSGYGRYAETVVHRAVPEAVVDVTIIPQPGLPYLYGVEGMPYFSAHEDRWLVSHKPSWVTLGWRRGESGADVQAPVADWCQVSPRVESEARRVAIHEDHAFARAPEFGRAKPPLFVTHSMDLFRPGHGDAQVTADMIRHCGGLLFPSLAIGPFPAPQFLPCVLVIDPMVVLESLKPYRKRGAPGLTRVYNSDSWTPKIKEIVTDFAAQLYDELTGAHGANDFMYAQAQHFLVSGLPTREGSGGFTPEGVVELTSVGAVARACWQHAARWPEKALLNARDTAKMFERNWTGHNFAKYPYCEAKIAAVLGFSAVSVAFVPDHQADAYRVFLQSAGYDGPVLPVPTDEEERAAFASSKADDISEMRARLRYGWRVAHLADALTPEGSRRHRRM